MSSKRAIRRKACEGKTRFRTADLARAAQARARKRKHVVQIYRCPFCHDYHIGHPPHGRGKADHNKVHK